MAAARRNPEATRAAILDAAEAIFLDRGMDATTTADIARLAGVTKSLIHHHFGSKAELWGEVKVRRFTEYAEEQAAMIATSDPNPDLLRQSMALYFGFLARNPEIVRLLTWMFLEDDDECGNVEQQLNEMGIAKIAEAQARGDFRSDIPPHFILTAFIGLTQHWFQFRSHLARHADLELSPDLDRGYLDAATKILFEGILPR